MYPMLTVHKNRLNMYRYPDSEHVPLADLLNEHHPFALTPFVV